RYETALAYRDFRRGVAEEPPRGDAPYDFVMGFLVNIHDPGLQVFGTHRLVHSLDDFDYARLVERLDTSDDFETQKLDQSIVDKPLKLQEVLRDAGERHSSFIFLSPASNTPLLVTFRGDTSSPIFDEETPDSVRELDVAILHEGIIDRMLGIDKEAQEEKTNLRYIKQLDRAVEARSDRQTQLVVLMNPTPVEQVARVCKSGGKMPQKSTYFYPKIVSGLTINPL
ncbi:MAG: DUF1015 family protein, partial [Persicimonas sp.]